MCTLLSLQGMELLITVREMVQQDGPGWESQGVLVTGCTGTFFFISEPAWSDAIDILGFSSISVYS